MLCANVCPGEIVDLQSSNWLASTKNLEDELIGHSINCYIGHSTDEKLCSASASGGLATELASFAIDTNLVEGVVVTKMNEKSPLQAKVFLARTREELVAASKSKYCPVPLGTSVDYLLRQDGKFAVVGLPCHIHGIRKAEDLISRLKSKIVLHIGLFCGHTVSFSGTEFLLQKLGVEKGGVAKLSYRGDGWPGGMTIELHSGRKVRIGLDYWRLFFSPNFFTPIRCILCSDFANELADLSLGDAWLPELLKHNLGESIVVTRTSNGEQLLREAAANKRIQVRKINPGIVIRSSKGSIYYKKKGLVARFTLMKAIGYPTPEIKTPPFKPNFASYIVAALTLLNIYVSSTPSTRKFLQYVPHPVLAMYSQAISKLNELS
jgi:coenzyme F420 hydrogenase subunit beta